jgi:hypothetical protein
MDPIRSDGAGDILGEHQWAWLGEVLGNATEISPSGIPRCAVTTIAGGIQFFMDEKPTEHWGNFPTSRHRLVRMLRENRLPRVVFLSGDVHYGEIGVDDSDEARSALGYPVVEVTSSGLTHSVADIPFVKHAFSSMFPSHRRVGAYLDRNFGLLELRGSSLESATLKISIHSVADGSVALSRIIHLKDMDFQPLVDDNATATISVSSPFLVKRVLLATQRTFFPGWPLHRIIHIFVLCALGLAISLVMLLLCALRLFLCSRTHRKKAD